MRDGDSAVLELPQRQMRVRVVSGAIVLGVEIEPNGKSYDLLGEDVPIQLIVSIKFRSLLYGRKRRRSEPL